MGCRKGYGDQGSRQGESGVGPEEGRETGLHPGRNGRSPAPGASDTYGVRSAMIRRRKPRKRGVFWCPGSGYDALSARGSPAGPLWGSLVTPDGRLGTQRLSEPSGLSATSSAWCWSCSTSPRQNTGSETTPAPRHHAALGNCEKPVSGNCGK